MFWDKRKNRSKKIEGRRPADPPADSEYLIDYMANIEKTNVRAAAAMSFADDLMTLANFSEDAREDMWETKFCEIDREWTIILTGVRSK